MKESTFMRQVMLDVSAIDECLIFRANVGLGWVSEHPITRLPNGDVVLRNARPLKTGLPKGFHDLFGIHRRTITPDMTGQTIGQFFSLETKTKTGRPTKEQLRFQSAIQLYGGRSEIIRPDTDYVGFFNDE